MVSILLAKWGIVLPIESARRIPRAFHVTCLERISDKNKMPFRSPWLVVIWAVMKTDYYFGESLWHLVPATVPAKIVMLLEFVTAFTTVVFLISDFVSMKDSMKRERT